MSDYKYILSFDPGLSTGVALGKYSDTEPYSLVEGFQFSGGVTGVKEWVSNHYEPHREDLPGAYHLYWDNPDLFTPPHATTIISEKYTVRPNGKGGQTRAGTMALPCEGALIALGVMPDYDVGGDRWRDPKNQYFVGGKTKAEKRKRLKQFLKDTNNYRFGKELGAPDNEDFVSATAHGINYVMTPGNNPTFELVSEWSKNYEG